MAKGFARVAIAATGIVLLAGCSSSEPEAAQSSIPETTSPATSEPEVAASDSPSEEAEPDEGDPDAAFTAELRAHRLWTNFETTDEQLAYGGNLVCQHLDSGNTESAQFVTRGMIPGEPTFGDQLVFMDLAVNNLCPENTSEVRAMRDAASPADLLPSRGGMDETARSLAESYFLNSVRSEGVGDRYTDEELIAGGDAFCDAIDGGKPLRGALIQVAEELPNLESTEAVAKLAGSASGTLCPEHVQQ